MREGRTALGVGLDNLLAGHVALGVGSVSPEVRVGRVAIPDFQTLMRPILATLADGQEWPVSALREEVGRQFHLSDEDLAALLPSGRDRTFRNRVGWAITYLAKTGCLRRPRRAVAVITDRGQQVLEANPHRVDMRVLAQFPEFDEFRAATGGSDIATAASVRAVPDAELSPSESMAALVDDANSTVAADVLARVMAKPPDFLERMVLQLLAAMGYGGLEATTEHLGGPGDEGLDGVIRQDALGLDVIYVQAKRYMAERKIGRPDIQSFVGALAGAQAQRGIFVTTSAFTPDARAYAKATVGSRVVLIDGPELAGLMVARNIGVMIDETYVVKRVSEDFFEED